MERLPGHVMTMAGSDLDLDLSVLPVELGCVWCCFPWDGFFSEDECIADGLWHDRKHRQNSLLEVKTQLQCEMLLAKFRGLEIISL